MQWTRKLGKMTISWAGKVKTQVWDILLGQVQEIPPWMGLQWPNQQEVRHNQWDTKSKVSSVFTVWRWGHQSLHALKSAEKVTHHLFLSCRKESLLGRTTGQVWAVHILYCSHTKVYLPAAHQWEAEPEVQNGPDRFPSQSPPLCYPQTVMLVKEREKSTERDGVCPDAAGLCSHERRAMSKNEGDSRNIEELD